MGACARAIPHHYWASASLYHVGGGDGVCVLSVLHHHADHAAAAAATAHTRARTNHHWESVLFML